MPITNKTVDLWSQVQLKVDGRPVKSGDFYDISYDVYLDNEYVGYLISDYALNTTVQNFLDKLAPDQSRLADVMSAVPSRYRFNYYYLNYLEIKRKWQGQGIGGIALQKWFSKLKSPAMVGLTPAKIANVPVDIVRKFYLKNGFKKVNPHYFVTFIKSK
jgi:hypothetical protein